MKLFGANRSELQGNSAKQTCSEILIFEPSETLASGEVLSLEEKFLAGEGQNLTPARLAVGQYDYQHILAQVQHTLERVAKLLEVEGYCRIDAFVRVLPDGKAETQVIEVNSLPGMTPATAIFHQAALAGYKPAAFIGKILEYGFFGYFAILFLLLWLI